jgi:hypothetical protein
MASSSSSEKVTLRRRGLKRGMINAAVNNQ